MSATATLAPSRAKIRAMLAPMPEAPPVISATLFSSLMRPSRLQDRNSIYPDRSSHHIADAGMDHEIGDAVERGRLAVDDRELGAIVLRQLGKARRRIDHERGAEHDKQVGGQRFLLGAAHRDRRHRLAERHGRGFDMPEAMLTRGHCAVALE